MVLIATKTRKGAVVQLTVEQKISKARMDARKLFPYWKKIFDRMQFIEIPAVGTMGVTHNLVCGWNRKFVEECSLSELTMTIVHEACHLLLKHPQRGCKMLGKNPDDLSKMGEIVKKSPVLKRKHMLANISFDMSINMLLEEIANESNTTGAWTAPYKLPDGYIVPETFDLERGEVAEYYFKKLLDKEKDKEEDDNTDDGDGESGDDSDQEDKNGDSSNEGESGEPCDSTESKPGTGQDHGSSTGVPGDWEAAIPDDFGRSESDTELIIEQTHEEVERLAKEGVGSVPDAVKLLSKEFLTPPEMDWTMEFSSALSNSISSRRGQDAHKFGRLSRTNIKMGLHKKMPIFPSRVAMRPKIGVIGDTSGSMGRDELAHIIGTVKGIAESTEAEIDFVACDSTVAGKPKRITDWAEVSDSLTGGGGTSFIPGFKAFADEDPPPETIVYVTDGQGAAPHKQPDWCTVIWVLVGDYCQVPWSAESGMPIDWGEMIYPDNK